MAKLPEIQPRGAVTRGAVSSVSAAEVANPFQQIANAFDSWGETLQAKANDDARIAGENAVHTDANGNLQVDLRPNFSEKNRVYNRSATQGLVAQQAPQIRAAAQKQAMEANGNPDAFAAGWKAYRDQTLINTPKELRGPITAMLDETGTLQRTGVVDQKFRSDMASSKSAILTEREYQSDQLASLALQGGTHTPEYEAALGKVRSLNDELTGNPVFQYSAREASIDMKRIEGRNMTESIVGQVDRTVASGGVAEAQKLRDQILNDPNLGLSAQERRTYFNIADSRIAGYVAQKKADLKPLQTRQASLVKDIAAGTVDINSPEIDSLGQQLARGGDVTGSIELMATRRRKVFADASSANQTTIAERALGEANRPAPTRNHPVSYNPDVSGRMKQAMQHYIARGVPPMLAAGIIGNLVQESSLNTGARNPGDGSDGSDSIGLGQWNGPRAKQLKAFASARGASPEDFATQLDFVLHELETTEGAAYRRLKAARNVDEATAAMIGFERPQGWSPDNPRGGHGWQNRLAAATKAAEMQGLTGEAIASQAGQFTAEEVSDYRKEITADVRATIPDIEAGIKSGVPFNSESLSLLNRQLAIVNDQDLRTQVADMLQRYSVSQAAQDMAPGELEATIGSLRQDMSENGATAAQLDLVTGLQAQQDERRQAIDKDALGYGISRGFIKAPPALDLANPDSWGPTFSSLQNGVDVMQARGEVGNISALRPEMQQQVARALAASTPQDSVKLLGSMAANMSPETYKSTLGALYTGGQSRAVAAAGALVPVNPEAAEGVLRGQQLLKENPMLAPKKSDSNAESIDAILPSSAFAPTLEGTRQSLLDAATARYADLSSQSADTSGELNEERMQQAITEVTGGLVDMNGVETVAPKYGMSQEDFDQTISGLDDEAMRGAVTSSGLPVKASDLRYEGRLRAVADGRYVLEFGSPERPTYALRQQSPGTYGTPGVFVLDLRNR